MPETSDADLVDRVATVLTRPRADAPDSFVLHAPLELLARAALLPHVSPDVRDRAREQILSIATRFEAFGPSAELGDHLFRHWGEATEALTIALAEGDLDTAGAAGRFLGRTLDPYQLVQSLGDHLVPSLAAAAHGPIFLHHLPRAVPRSPLAGAMFGTLAREVARNPDWALRWHDSGLTGTGDLATSLAATPVLGPPDSTFIRPLMAQAEESGLAAKIVGGAIGPGTDPGSAATTILRTATASMLLDDPDHAPYGWSHCLTIPQGILSTLTTTQTPDVVLAVAATHVVGFRAALGSAPLDALGSVDGIASPDGPTFQAAVDFAAGHQDAHLTKYLVSCMDAARSDPEGAAQHLRAAVRLADWWRAADQ